MKTTVVTSDGTFSCSTAPLQGPLPQVARQAAALGFDALQLTAARPEDLDIPRIQEAVRSASLRISGIATGRANSLYGLSLGAGEEERRQRSVACMEAFLDAAARLDHAAIIIGSIRGRFADAASPEEYLRQFTESLCQLLPRAEANQVPLLLEVFNHRDADAFFRVRETTAYVRSFHSPWLRLQLDTGHLLMEGETPDRAVAEAGDLLAQVDLTGPGRQAPQAGDFDFPGLIRALEETAYTGYLSFEYRPDSDGAARGLQYMQGLRR